MKPFLSTYQNCTILCQITKLRTVKKLWNFETGNFVKLSFEFRKLIFFLFSTLLYLLYYTHRHILLAQRIFILKNINVVLISVLNTWLKYNYHLHILVLDINHKHRKASHYIHLPTWNQFCLCVFVYHQHYVKGTGLIITNFRVSIDTRARTTPFKFFNQCKVKVTFKKKRLYTHF